MQNVRKLSYSVLPNEFTAQHILAAFKPLPGCYNLLFTPTYKATLDEGFFVEPCGIILRVVTNENQDYLVFAEPAYNLEWVEAEVERLVAGRDTAENLHVFDFNDLKVALDTFILLSKDF